MSFELFIALRYLKTKRKGIFTLITTAIGIAGVSIGVAALLTTLSVMNGFQADIREKIVGAQAHLTVHARMTEEKRATLARTLAAQTEVAAVSPFTLGQAIITFGERSTGFVLKGIRPAEEFAVNNLQKSLTYGTWDAIGGNEAAAPSAKGRTARSGDRGPMAAVVLGEELARNLGAWIGDTVVVVSPQGVSTPMGLLPAMKRFRVVGLIKTGYYEFDSATGYTALDEAAAFFKTPGGLSGMQARLTRLEWADRVSERLQKTLGWDYAVTSFTQMNRTLFAALKLEKSVMFLILILIIVVASFNIASNLILMGTEKTRDIGLLKAMGATPGQIRRIFLWVGLLIGGVGIGVGVLLGLFLSWVIWRFPIVELPPDIYYLSRVPVRVELFDVLGIMVSGLLLSALATLYPAFRAAKVDPVEAIHYHG